jgi:uncharacterized membrane protein (DUF4010 family)
MSGIVTPHALGARALIIANVGTVVLRSDGSARIVDRNRNSYEIAPEIVRALAALASQPRAVPHEETAG